MAHIKFDGFDEFEKELDKLSKQINNISGNIPLDELLNDDFIRKHTQFANLYEFLDYGGFVINSEEDFDAIPQEKLDEHTAKTTDFEN